ncbi:hypothetical protein D6C91_09733 [Aureobasidium pullulans]|uniref:Uncharacterized protein n=1 Tax=Aureobasidium pullulans TaxID=5580 RepID=A0A4S9SHG9_AURPU|nr:hypothetical protein D6C91_09733 [Aureobasidium pullulans]
MRHTQCSGMPDGLEDEHELLQEVLDGRKRGHGKWFMQQVADSPAGMALEMTSPNSTAPPKAATFKPDKMLPLDESTRSSMEQDHQLPIACSFSSSTPPNLAIIGAIHLFLRQAITLLSPAGPSLCLFSSTHLVIPDLRLPLGLTGSLKDLVEKRQIGGMYVPSLITSSKAKNHVLSPSPPRSPPPNFPAGHAVGSVKVMLAFMCLHCSYHLSAQEMALHAQELLALRPRLAKNVPAILIPYLNDDIRAKDALLHARHRQSAHLRINSSTEGLPHVLTRNMTSDELLRREQLTEQQRNRRALEDLACSGPAGRSPMELDSDDLARRRTMSRLPVSAAGL